MKQLFTLLTVCTIALSPAHAQKGLKEPKYGDIAPWEWDITSFKGDTSVGAIILADYGKFVFNANFGSGGSIYEFYQIKRIKILKQSAADQLANVVIIYAKEDESITKLKAHSLYKDASGKIVENEVDDDKIVDEQLNKERRSLKIRAKRFSIPKVQPGSIIEYSYRRPTTSVSPPRWVLQSEYPCIKSRLTYSYPTAIKFGVEYSGIVKISSSEEVKVGSIALGYNSFDVMQRDYFADSIPGFSETSFLYSPSNYYSSVNINFKDLRLEMGTDRKLANSWLSISRDLQKDKRFFNEEGKNEKRISEKALSLKSDDTLSTIKNVYNFLKNDIKTIKFSDVEDSEELVVSLDKALVKKEASEPIKLTLALRIFANLGYDPAVIFIRTRDNGFVEKSSPTLSQFDQYAIVVSTSKAEYILDFSDNDYPFGVLPESYYNGQAWVVTSKEDYWVELPMLTSHDVNIVLNGTLDKEGGITGSFSTRHAGYAASEVRSIWKKKGSHHWLNKGIFKETTQLKVKEAKTDTSASNENAIVSNGSYEKSNFAQDVNDELYFNPILIPPVESNPFKSEKRDLPIEYDYKSNLTYMLNLTIPEGYVPEEVPKSIRFVVPDKSIEFIRMVSVSDQQMTIQIRFVNRKLVYSPEEYGYLRQLYDVVTKASNEQIVLKPKN
jgi:hypothetical protein